jgi:hypothetical protein
MLMAINVTISISRNNTLANHSIAFKDINAAMYKDHFKYIMATVGLVDISLS